MHSPLTDIPLFAVLTATLVSALVLDVWRMRIPNAITFPGMLIGLGYHGVTGGAHGFLLSLGGLALCLGVFLIPYAMGGMGAGDVKLMAAVGAMLGPVDAFWAMVCTALIGGVYAVLVLLMHVDLLKYLLVWIVTEKKTVALTGTGTSVPADSRPRSQPVLRYGVAIVLGTFGFLLWRFYI